MRMRLACGCSLLAVSTLLGAMPAIAQAVELAPPTRYQVDENGVDMAALQIRRFRTDASIGPAGAGGLAQLEKGAGHMNDTLSAFQNGTIWTVNIGTVSEQFTKSGSTFVSTTGRGSTLVQTTSPTTGTVYTLTTADGMKYVYNENTQATGDWPVITRISSITYPSGEVATYHWTSVEFCTNLLDYCQGGQYHTRVRLQSITHSSGYQLHYDYDVNDFILPSAAPRWNYLRRVTAFDATVNPCDPLAPTCTFTQSWPTASYTEASGSTVVTDAANRSHVYAQSGGVNGYYEEKRASSPGYDFAATYSASGLTVVKDGRTWAYASSVSGTTRTTVVTTPTGGQRTIVADTSIGLPTSVKNELNQTTTYAYDTAGRLTRITAPEGNYVQYAYDARGNVTSTTSVAKTGSGLANVVTSAAYPATCTNAVTCNKPTSTTDAGGTTSYTYDPTHGGVLSVTAPAMPNGVHPQTRYGYTNYSGRWRQTSIAACKTTASCTGGVDEVKTTVAYSGTGLFPTSVTSGGNGLWATTTTTYDNIGNPITVDGPLAGTADISRTVYNLGREVVGTIGPDPDGGGALLPRAMRITRDSDGAVTAVEAGTVASGATDVSGMTVLQTASLGYDGAKRKISARLITGGVTQSLAQYSYTDLDQVECTVTRMNPTTFASPPAACSLGTEGTFGPDRISKTTYDAAGRPILVQTAVGTAYASDEAAGTYTTNGKLATLTDAEGHQTTYEYDGFDRLAKTRYPTPTGTASSSTTDYEALTYDSRSNVTQRRLRDGQVIGYTYDNLSRLTTKDVPNLVSGEQDISYVYDNLGRLVSASDTSGHTNGFVYDGLGRTTTESSYFGSKAMQYDLAGRLTQLTYPGGPYVNYDHLVTGEVTAIRENGAASGVGVLGTYSYDALGRRTTLTRGNGTVTSYGYDTASRLTSLTQNLGGTTNDQTLGFTYNPAGQIITNTRSNDAYAWNGHYNVDRPYTINGLNQMTASGAVALGYDGRGNLTTSGSASYAYTSENRLAKVGADTISYHPSGDLMLMTLGGAQTRFDYLGGRIVAELNSSNVVQRRYVYGPGDDEPLVWYEGSGTSQRYWLHADERGSVVAVSDGSGNAVGLNAYDEYGIPAATNMGRFQYTGQAWLPEIGLYYYKARMYSPTLGRFMQTDPIGYGDGMNMYGYVGADPVNATDPSGTQLDPAVTPVQYCKDACTGSRIPGNIAPGLAWGGNMAGWISGGMNGGGGGGWIAGTPGSVVADDNLSVITAGVPGYFLNVGYSGMNSGNYKPQNGNGDIVVTAAAGIGHNGGPPLDDIVVTGARSSGLRWLGGIIGAIIGDIFFPDPACCFTAGTLVDTPTGLKPIETLRIGDLVISRDSSTGATMNKPIVGITPAHERHIWTVTVSYKGKDGRWRDERYETTDDHPWRTEDGRWVTSAALKEGQSLARENGTAIVVSVVDTGKINLTYNLTIADFHTYFVGQARTWVHNQCGPSAGEARRAFRTDRNFQTYFHRWKQSSGLAGDGAGTRNRNLSDREMLEAYEDWIADGRPGR